MDAPDWIAELIAPCIYHIEKFGGEVYISCTPSPPEMTERVAAYEREFQVKLPPIFREFYLHGCDGLLVSWGLEDDNVQPLPDHADPRLRLVHGMNHGQLPLPDLAELRLMRQQWMNMDRHPSGNDFRSVDDPKLAERVWEAMWHWLPLWDEGNGDRVCVNLATEEIVLHEHDWNDAGSGFNGIIMASDLTTFVDRWARKCFVNPITWQRAAVNGRLDWDSDRFPKKFCV